MPLPQRCSKVDTVIESHNIARECFSHLCPVLAVCEQHQHEQRGIGLDLWEPRCRRRCCGSVSFSADAV